MELFLEKARRWTIHAPLAISNWPRIRAVLRHNSISLTVCNTDRELALFYYSLVVDQSYRGSQICHASLLECVIPRDRWRAAQSSGRAAVEVLESIEDRVLARFRYTHLLVSVDDSLVNSNRPLQVDRLLANERQAAMNGGKLAAIRQLQYHSRRDEQTR
jgi:hypothetical protein